MVAGVDRGWRMLNKQNYLIFINMHWSAICLECTWALASRKWFPVGKVFNY